ncbi:MAG: T9SS type A sorting domain-containing protein, partial [Flavobacteriales bacterium]
QEVSKKANLEVNTQDLVQGRIEVRDMTGSLVLEEKNVQFAKGSSRYSIDMSGEESGIYSVRFVTDEGQSITERFSVVGR